MLRLLSMSTALACAAAACVASTPPGPIARPAPFTAPDVVAPVVPPADPKPKDPVPAPSTQTASPQDLVFPTEAFRASQPPAGPDRPLTLPPVKSFTLANGLQVYLVEQHDLPIVSLDLNFNGGSAIDPAGKEGLATTCMSLVNEGTTRLDKIAYAEALADVASSISTYAAADSQGVSMSTLSKNFDGTFGLFAEALLQPGMRAADLERITKRRIEAVRQAKATPASIVDRVQAPVMYGDAHPYGRVTTETSLAAVTLEDCNAFHAKWFKPRGARLFVVGDLTEAQLRQAFARPEIAALTGKAPAQPRLPAPKGLTGRLFFVDVPGAAQSQVLATHFGPKRTATDYFPTAIMNAVLGGGFSSRINMNLREAKGYTYGARGGISYTRDYGEFEIGAPVRSDATYLSALEIMREMTDLKKGTRPITADELAREKSGAIQGLPGRFATSGDALRNYRSLVYYGLPMDYFAKFAKTMNRVTAKSATATAAKHVHPNNAAWVIVGDGNAEVSIEVGADGQPTKKLKLREALDLLIANKTLGAGELVILDADGRRK